MNIHIGKRGSVLLAFGAAWVFMGLGIRDLPQVMSIPLFHAIPMHIQALPWFITGALAMALALTNRTEWMGYPVLVPMPFLQVVGYGWWFATNRHTYTGIAVWLLFIVIIILLADWAEPPTSKDSDQ